MAERDSGQPESVDGSGPPGREVGATSFLQRAVIRRRVRFLHRRRELALYDLGGFLFESHRLGQPHNEILTEKLEALTTLDHELALLQHALRSHEEIAVLSEPGVAACSHCGTLRDSAANFCPGCGRPAAETAPLAAPAANARGEFEGLSAVPDATVEVGTADISAGQETEIAAAEQAGEPRTSPPDATAEMSVGDLHEVWDSGIAAAGQADEPEAPPAPDPTAQMAAAEHSAVWESEIPPAERADEAQGPLSPDATAEMAAVRWPFSHETDSAEEPPVYEADRPDEPPAHEADRPDEPPAHEADRPDEPPAHEADRPDEPPAHYLDSTEPSAHDLDSTERPSPLNPDSAAGPFTHDPHGVDDPSAHGTESAQEHDAEQAGEPAGGGEAEDPPSAATEAPW